jgi:hypothetical protein
MPKFKHLITTLIFIILFSVDCFGNAVFTEFTVLSWQQNVKDELEIKIIDSKNIEKVVHIRFNPDRLTLLIQDKDKRSSAEQQYNEAFTVLKKQLSQSEMINVWLYSDKGFIPIENRPGGIGVKP